MFTHSASHLAVVLCAMVSTGRIRLPLSHSHALECVACFTGHHSWNKLASLPDAEIAKIRARALRAAINAQSKDGILTAQSAEEAIASVIDEYAETDAARRPNSPKISTFPITFFRHPFDGEWEADDPNVRVDDEEIDALAESPNTEDTRQQLESLFAAYPGDIDVCHTLASRLFDDGQRSSALSIWRHAWSFIQPGLDKVLREAPNAVVSYSSLRNRPILRVLNGLATCVGTYRDEASLIEYEKLVRMGYSFMRYRDTFGFKSRLVRCMANRGEWKDIKHLFEPNESATFNERAIEILAFHYLGEKKQLAKAQKSVIASNPFAAEVLFRGRKVEGYSGEFVTLGTWQEGAEHMVLFADLWRASDAWKIWRAYRQRIQSAQSARLEQYWSTRSVVGRDPRYLGALLEKLGGLHGKNMPLMRNERSLVPSLIPDDFLSTLFAIELTEVQSLGIQSFEDWLRKGHGIHFERRGLIFEWLVWRMIEDGAKRLVVKSGSLYFDERCAMKVSRDLQNNLWDIIAWELDGQLLDRPLLVRAPNGMQTFECRFSGKWTHEDAGIELVTAS